MKNQSAYLENARHIVIKDSPMPEVGPEDVLIKIENVTICGSDATFFVDPTFHGVYVPPVLPIILGHECGGEVIQLGENVKHLAVGDKVAIEPGAGCGVCSYCLTGHYNLCREMDFMAAYPFHRGALSRYVSHPAKMVFKLPENMDTVEGALIEPLAVGMHAVKRSGAGLGDTAVVLGAGTIGLMTIAAAKAMGVDRIIAIDLFPNRLENALEMGATITVNAQEKDTIESVLALTNGLGADVVFETAGNSKTAVITPDITRPGGKIVTVGNIHGETPFEFLKSNDKEIDIISVFRYVNDYPMCIEAVRSGKIQIKQLVSKTFPFEKSEEAFNCSVDEKDKVVKVCITMGE